MHFVNEDQESIWYTLWKSCWWERRLRSKECGQNVRGGSIGMFSLRLWIPELSQGCCSPVKEQWSKQEDHDWSSALLGTVRCFSYRPGSSLATNLITSLNRAWFDWYSGLYHPQGNTPEICLQHWVKYSQSWPTNRKKILTNKHMKKYVWHH